MKEKFFDADRFLEGYERNTGNKASEYLIGLTHELETLINSAYKQGFELGLEAAYAEVH